MADNTIAEYQPSWFGSIVRWSASSKVMLRNAEKRILSCLRSAYRGWYVDIGPVVGPADKIWTISMNEDSPRTPLVLLHGLGAGVALWCMNLDAFAATRPVYAIDLLGFGRSSRPPFSSDAMEAEQQLVRSVEEWRKEMKLEKMILLGHSLGGFLASSYAINHPDRVKHLILADPWGFCERPSEQKPSDYPLWVRAIAYAVRPLNPLWAVRVAGPFGQWFIGKMRPDIIKKFSGFINSDENIIPEYLYQCNSQNPTGEGAFHAMMTGFIWAKHPMGKRLSNLQSDIPITILNGARSWVDNSVVDVIKMNRTEFYVNVQVIKNAGHHVYADQPDVFNKHVVNACFIADNIIEVSPLSVSAESDTDLESDKLDEVKPTTSK